MFLLPLRSGILASDGPGADLAQLEPGRRPSVTIPWPRGGLRGQLLSFPRLLLDSGFRLVPLGFTFPVRRSPRLTPTMPVGFDGFFRGSDPLSFLLAMSSLLLAPLPLRRRHPDVDH